MIIGTSTLTRPDFNDDTVEELRQWRRNIAHHINNYDALSDTSLVTRVCSISDGLSVRRVLRIDCAPRCTECVD